MNRVELKVDGGLEHIERFAQRMQELLSPVALTARAVEIAREAGHALLAASVRAAVEAIYDQPEGEYDRTGELLAAHEVVEYDGGMTQAVTINPTIDVEDPHNGRETVYDYAVHVHDGYTQWVFGRDTGIFHPGKFWFHVAEEQSTPVILSYISQAWFEAINILMREAAS